MRITVPIGGAIRILGSKGRRVGISLQNTSAVDVYYSDDQRLLDSVGAANLPSVGHLLAAATPVPPPVVYPWFIGDLYARAQSNGAQLEVLVYEVDPVPTC